MIKEVTKYYTDIDCAYTFDKREDAEKFERTFKPFYDLNEEAEQVYDNVVANRDNADFNRMKLAEELFNKAMPLLIAYVKENRMFDDNTKKELCNLMFCKMDVGRVVDIFFHEDLEDCIIGKLFDTIYMILFNW